MKRTSTNWFPTYTGKRVYPGDLKPDDVCIEDIAHSLSLQCRFAGHIKGFYSVAQHCYLAAYYAPKELKLAALLHDACEAYCQDVISPIKNGWRLTPYKRAEKRITRVIFERFNLTHLLPALDKEVKEIDMRMLMTERRDLYLGDAGTKFDWEIDAEPYESVIWLQDPETAELKFLFYFNHFTKGTSNV